jgi:hypothetical protein
MMELGIFLESGFWGVLERAAVERAVWAAELR